MDWTEIERQLQEVGEGVCRHLLPNGKRVAGEWVAGSVGGEAGESLKVNLAGKVGLWRDFAGDKGGKTLMSLWCAVRGSSFRECIGEAKGFLGIRDDFGKRVARYPAPAGGSGERAEESGWKAVGEIWKLCQVLTEGGPVWRYLVEERRLEPAVLGWYGVRELLSQGRWVVVWPYYGCHEREEGIGPVIFAEGDSGERVPSWLKFERLDRPGGKKVEWTSKGPEKCLWGMGVSEGEVFKGAKDVLLCEGEKDALSWASYGCGAWGMVPVSVPFGAKWRGSDPGRPSPNREWLDRCWGWLSGFECVYVAMDSDEAGRRAAADVVMEIGPRRCRLVELPVKEGAAGVPGVRFKDVNECLMAGVAGEVMRGCLGAARDFAPEKVVHAGELEEEFMASWFEELGEAGLELPWEFPWRIRLGELTVWTGIEKSGKTTLLGFVLMGLLAQGERALVASLEVKYTETLKKYSRQAFGGLPFDKRLLKRAGSEVEAGNIVALAKEQARGAFRWLSQNLWVYKHTGIAHWKQLLEDWRWARRRHGITQFIGDNFMRMGIAKDDYAQQADAITAFTSFAMETGSHVHMVVHQNKSEGHKGEGGGKRTVSGAFEIIANAHNIVEVQRDVRKGERVSDLFEKRKIGQISEAQFREERAAQDLVPDGKFILHNQRAGDVQNGSKYLWFLWESQQYADKPPGHAQHGAIRFSKRGVDGAKGELPTSEELGV